MPPDLSYQGLLACAALLALMAFKIGHWFGSRTGRRHSAAAERIRQKYQAHRSTTERV